MRLARTLSLVWRSGSRRGVSRVRARRAVVGFALAVVAFNLGLAVALETVLPEWRDPDAGWKIRSLRKFAEPRVVALGSSRTQMGLAPITPSADAPPVFNFGMPGAGPFHHRLSFDRLCRQGLEPKALMVEILPAALGSSARSEVFIRLQPGRYNHADLRAMLRDTDKPDGVWWAWITHRLNPWHEQRLIILSHLLPGFLPWNTRQDYRWTMSDATGWLARPMDSDSPADRAKRLAKSRDEYANSVEHLCVQDAPMAALRALAEDCRRHGIPLAFYIMPESPAFRAWYGLGKQDEVRAALRAMVRETQTVLLDAWDWMDEEDFADGHHLTKTGAIKFSQKFQDELYLPWYRSISAGQP